MKVGSLLVLGVLSAQVAAARPLPAPKLVCGDDLSACDRTLLWDSAQVPNAPALLADALLACTLKGQDLPTAEQFGGFAAAGANYRAWVKPSPERPATVANIIDGAAGTLLKADGSKPESYVCVRETFAVPTVDNPTSIAASDPLYGLASDWIAALQALPEALPKVEANAASCRRDKVAGVSTCHTSFAIEAAAAGSVRTTIVCAVSDDLIYPPDQTCLVALVRNGGGRKLAIGGEMLVQIEAETPADRYPASTGVIPAKGKAKPEDVMSAEVPAAVLGAGIKSGHLLFRAGTVDVVVPTVHRPAIAWVLARLRRLLIEGIQRKAVAP